MEIKPLLKQDIPSVVALEEELLLETLGVEMLQAELHNKYAHFLCAKDGEKVIGYIGAWIIDNSCEMINFVVDKDYQHQGNGQNLFNKLQEEAIKQGATYICLEVRISNIKAINFYFKNGFQEINRRISYYKNGEDALVLRKELIWRF